MDSVSDWVVVIEARTDRSDESFEFAVVHDLLARLREWRSSGLYNPRRYVIQLHVAAAVPYEALRRAVAYHDLAARAVGLAGSSLTRAEVLTLGEFELGMLLPPAPVSAPSPRTRNLLISDELYRATRALLHVTTGAEITDVLVRFVTSVGGSVNMGECQPVVGTVSVDVSIGNEPLHAVADNLSVAGMIMEQSLPSLVADARLTLRQLQETNG